MVKKQNSIDIKTSVSYAEETASQLNVKNLKRLDELSKQLFWHKT